MKSKKHLLIYAIPTLAALLVRIILLINWWESPVRYYYKVGGLDMKSILETGTWLYNGQSTFSIYKAILATILFFNNGIHCPEAIVIIQLLGGIIVAPITVWCTLRIWGNRYWALTSGLIAALYAPALMYQVLVLKESILLLFALLSLMMVLWTHKHHFSALTIWTCGIFLALACVCRTSALPFCGLAILWIVTALFKKYKNTKKTILTRTALLLLGIFTVFVPVSITNGYLTKETYLLPVQVPSISYLNKFASVDNATSLNLPKQKVNKKSKIIINVAKKIPLTFSASEIPNNVNYYFLKYKLFPLQYLFGPLFLLPLATTALILLILNRGIFRKESILFVFIFSYMLSLCYFYPLARYRLVMIPVFCMLAPYPFYALKKSWRRKKLLFALLPLIVWAIVLYLNIPVNSFLRATDFVSYGKGIEFKTGKSITALPYFHKAYQIAPYKQMTIVNFSDALLKNNRAKDALIISSIASQNDPDNPVYQYYLAVVTLFNGNAKESEKLFAKINPDRIVSLKVQYYYYFGEAIQRQGKNKIAKELYQKALKAKPTENQKILLDKSIRDCNGK